MKDLSWLGSSHYDNHKSKTYFCQYCLHGCISEKVLKNHLERCKLNGAQRIKLLEADGEKGRDKVKFTKTGYQLRFPFVIYADFEIVLDKQDSCELSSSKSFTTQYQYHVLCASCIYIKCNDGQYFEPPQVNIGDDTAEKFLDQALATATICRKTWPIKSLWNGWPKNSGGNTKTPSSARSALNHSNQQIKKSATTIIWRVNIEVQLTTHATWITSLIQRKWKFLASLTTSKSIYVIYIFTIASFWFSCWNLHHLQMFCNKLR